MTLHPQIIEKQGKKEFVVLPYEEFIHLQEQLEDYEDLRELRRAKDLEENAPTTPISAVKDTLGI